MKTASWIIGLILAAAPAAGAQAPQPAANPPSPPAPPAAAVAPAAGDGQPNTALSVRANEAFSTGQYVLALPLLKKLQATEKPGTDDYGATSEQIKVCEANLAIPSAPPTPAAGGAPAVPMAPETRKPHPVPKPGETLEMGIKELGNFEYDQQNGGDIPDDVKKLSGSTIRLTGFMVPSDQAENITEFALVPSLFSCCFGQPPQLQHTVMCECPAGKAVSYCPDPVVIEGKLTVEEKKDDGFIVSIFTVSVSSVKPAPK